jgi:hypothetical protein
MVVTAAASSVVELLLIGGGFVVMLIGAQGFDGEEAMWTMLAGLAMLVLGIALL